MYKFFVIILLILILLNTCMGCTFMIAKETAKAINIVLEDDPNSAKKEKIIIKQDKMKWLKTIEQAQTKKEKKMGLLCYKKTV